MSTTTDTSTKTTTATPLVIDDYLKQAAAAKAATKTKTTTSSDNSSLSKNDFLNLLVTQLRYQDPMNPADNQQMAAQMAQFSSLEQTQNMAASLDKMTTTIQTMVDNQNKTATTMSSSSATSLMGKTVRLKQTDADFVSSSSPLTFNVTASSGSEFAILDSKSKVVRTISLDGTKGDGTSILDANGDGTVTWNGLTDTGTVAGAGTYSLVVQKAGTSTASGSAWTDATVSGVEFATDGPRLVAGGKAYKMEDLLSISNSTTGTTASNSSTSTNSNTSL